MGVQAKKKSVRIPPGIKKPFEITVRKETQSLLCRKKEDLSKRIVSRMYQLLYKSRISMARNQISILCEQFLGFGVQH